MIVFIGDWVKFNGKWKQVTDVHVGSDTFAVLDCGGEPQWFGTEVAEVFEEHISNIEMQSRLKEAGL